MRRSVGNIAKKTAPASQHSFPRFIRLNWSQLHGVYLATAKVYRQGSTGYRHQQDIRQLSLPIQLSFSVGLSEYPGNRFSGYRSIRISNYLFITLSGYHIICLSHYPVIILYGYNFIRISYYLIITLSGYLIIRIILQRDNRIIIFQLNNRNIC